LTCGSHDRPNADRIFAAILGQADASNPLPGKAMTLEELEARLLVRAKASPDESYTARLVAAGASRAAKKLGEEAVETVIAAVTGDKSEIAREGADLLYHLIVTLIAAGVPLADVMTELDRRTAQSGLAEKAARSPK